jgi:hypothetical protein
MIRPIAALLLAAACAEAAHARPLKPEQEARIRQSGEAVKCVQRSRIRETRVRNDRTIDFYMLGGQVYRNRLPQVCAGLGFEERFGYATGLDDLCAVDVIHVIHMPPTIPGAACGLGNFQPITGAPR